MRIGSVGVEIFACVSWCDVILWCVAARCGALGSAGKGRMSYGEKLHLREDAAAGSAAFGGG